MRVNIAAKAHGRPSLTLFAGFVFSFSKIFCDCAFVALMANADSGVSRCRIDEGSSPVFVEEE